MTMNAQDWQDQHNDRAEVVRILSEFCNGHGFSYEYTEKLFKVKLPRVEPLPVAGQIRTRNHTAPNWTLDEDAKGVKEDHSNILPDELPPTTTPLEEGEPPKGDEEK